METAEADYNALKSHLLEKLPQFSEKAVDAVNLAIGCYIWSNKRLAKKMQKLHEMVLAVVRKSVKFIFVMEINSNCRNYAYIGFAFTFFLAVIC